MRNFVGIITWPFKFVLINLFVWITAILSLAPHVEARKGERFVTLADIETHGALYFRAPFSSDFKCVIPKGTILVAANDGQRVSLGFQCTPEAYKEFEKKFVPEEERSGPKYDGYSFVMKYRDIGKKIEKV